MVYYHWAFISRARAAISHYNYIYICIWLHHEIQETTVVKCLKWLGVFPHFIDTLSMCVLFNACTLTESDHRFHHVIYTSTQSTSQQSTVVLVLQVSKQSRSIPRRVWLVLLFGLRIFLSISSLRKHCFKMSLWGQKARQFYGTDRQIFQLWKHRWSYWDGFGFG